MANFSMVLPNELLIDLGKKARETGMTNSDLARLAIASFLSKEDALAEYLDAVDGLHSQLAVLTKRQEQFARTLGALCITPEQHKNESLKQIVADRFNQIIDTIN